LQELFSKDFFSSLLPEEKFRITSLKGLYQMKDGKNKEAINTLCQAIEYSELVNDQSLVIYNIARTYDWLAISYSNINNYSCVSYFEKMIKIAQQLGDKRLETLGYLNLADELTYWGEIEKCATVNQKAIVLAKQIGDLDYFAYGLSNSGHINLLLGSPSKAIEEIEKAINIFSEIGSQWNFAYCMADLSIANLQLGNLELAYSQASIAITYAEGTNSFMLGYSLLALARVEDKLEKWEQADITFLRALKVFTDSGDDTLSNEVNQYYQISLLKRKL
jgi:tetratricopeptide (TPR) repeat protein